MPKIKRLRANAECRVWSKRGKSNAWSLEAQDDYDTSAVCQVALEIQGNDKRGYNLVMSPAGFFTADNWHESLPEAMESAQEMFGVGPEQWEVVESLILFPKERGKSPMPQYSSVKRINARSG
jgi:hypothetical protein